jgi:hypothetical protein
MFLLDSLLIGGVRFVLDTIVQAAQAEAQDESALRERLLAAQTLLELGEMTQEEFAAVERDFIAAVQEIRGARRQGPISMPPGNGGAAEIQSVDLDC